MEQLDLYLIDQKQEKTEDQELDSMEMSSSND